MFGRRRRQRETERSAEAFIEAANQNPEIWRMLETGSPEAYLDERFAELAFEFAAQPSEEQQLRLERSFAEMYAALNEGRAEDFRSSLASVRVMVAGRRLARVDLVLAAAREAAEEGMGAVPTDLAQSLTSNLDRAASALEDEEAKGAIQADDTAYRTFTINEEITRLVARHLLDRGPAGATALIEVLTDSFVHLSQNTPSGHPLPDFDLEPND